MRQISKEITLFSLDKIFKKQFFLFVFLAISIITVYAAEVVIDNSVNSSSATHNGSSPTVVFVSDQVGYDFYRDSNGSCVYGKTTNGGTSWGGAVTIDSSTNCFKIAVWYDRWTPGDNSGNYIYIATAESTTDDTWYARLDTSSDTLTTLVNATGANQGGSFDLQTVISITKATNNTIYMGTSDNSDSFVIKCSSNCDQAANWTEAGTNPFDLVVDWIILMPLSGGNVMAIRTDVSAEDIQSKVYNNSLNSWDANWTDIDTSASNNGTYDAHFGATLDKSNNNIYLVYAADVASLGSNDDIRTAVYNGSSWTNKTDVLTDSSLGITGVKVAIDDNTKDIYVLYTGRTTPGTASTGNVYWKKSTDGMSSWGTQQGPLNSASGNIYGARENIVSDERIYASWFDSSVLYGNTVVDLTPPDTTAPSAVSNLAVSGATDTTVNVSWTAPGDDNNSGTATTYDLRYSTSAITDGNFNLATQAISEPSPSVAGSSESMTVSGLTADTTYYFALKTSDEVPNTSAISNVPSLATTAAPPGPDTTAPAAISGLTLSIPTTSSITVSWTAPGDDNNTGTATTYDLRYSTSLITDGNFSSATVVVGEPIPDAAGTSQSAIVGGLLSGTTYYFALKTSDEVPNTSAISNVPSLATSEEALNLEVPSGGGGTTAPTSVFFSGQAYPNSKIEIYRRSIIETVYKNTYSPNTEAVADQNGFFQKNFVSVLQGDYLFSLEAMDKDGRSSGIVSFTADLVSKNNLTVKNIFFPPTVDFGQTSVSKGQNLKIFGYASPNNKIEIKIDNALSYQAISNSGGYYEYSVNTQRFSPKSHFIVANQVDKSGRKSGSSQTKTFTVTLLAYPQTDLNGSGSVDISDWSIFLSRWRSLDAALKSTLDINNDGKVDIADLSIFLKSLKGL